MTVETDETMGEKNPLLAKLLAANGGPDDNLARDTWTRFGPLA